MGAWIEIVKASSCIPMGYWSLPTWERGLKSKEAQILTCGIESLPTWERGLKSESLISSGCSAAVAPYMGAWIEIM